MKNIFCNYCNPCPVELSELGILHALYSLILKMKIVFELALHQVNYITSQNIFLLNYFSNCEFTEPGVATPGNHGTGNNNL